MGALNLDAEEIKKHKLIQEKQEMVEVCLFVCLFMYVDIWWRWFAIGMSNLTLMHTPYVHTHHM